MLPPGQSRPGVVLAESLMLSLGGGVIGAVVTWLGLPALRALTPRVLPRLDEVTFDAGVFVFSAVLCVLTGFVFGIVPAWRASRRDTTSELPGSGGHVWRGRLGATVLVALLAVQVALAFVLLAGAGLAIRAFADLRGRDVGIDPSGLLSFDVHLPRDPYVTPNVAQVGSIEIAEYSPAGPALYDRIHAALQTMPGVVQAAGVGTQPFTSAPFVQFWIEEQEHTPDNQVAAQYLAVTENYFNTMGIRVIRGRDFSPADQPDSPWVILVNEALARQHWPNGDPIGQRLTLTFHPNDGEPPREIVGLVADTLPFRGASEVPPLIYLLHRQQAAQQRASLEGRRTVMSFIVRTAGDPLALGDAVRALVGKVDVTTPVTSIRTVESYLNAGQVMLLQFAATLLGIFALVALVTGAAGIYGFTSYGVTRASHGAHAGAPRRCGRRHRRSVWDSASGGGSAASSSRFSRTSRSRHPIPCRSSSPAACSWRRRSSRVSFRRCARRGPAAERWRARAAYALCRSPSSWTVLVRHKRPVVSQPGISSERMRSLLKTLFEPDGARMIGEEIDGTSAPRLKRDGSPRFPRSTNGTQKAVAHEGRRRLSADVAGLTRHGGPVGCCAGSAVWRLVILRAPD